MDLGATQTAITSWVEDNSTLELEWGRQPQIAHPGPFVLAYAGPITATGHDEKTYVYNEVTDVLDEQMLGVRHLTLRLSFRSFDQRLGNSARQYAEEFRLLTQSSSSIETLFTADLGLVSTGELVETDYVWSGRMVSQVDMDVVLAFRADVSNTNYDGAYIWHANIDSQGYVIDEAGNVVVDEDGDYVTDEAADTISVNP